MIYYGKTVLHKLQLTGEQEQALEALIRRDGVRALRNAILGVLPKNGEQATPTEYLKTLAELINAMPEDILQFHPKGKAKEAARIAVYTLHHHFGLSVKQISDSTGLDPSTVRRRKRRFHEDMKFNPLMRELFHHANLILN